MKVNTKRVRAEEEKTEEIHNPFGSTNCIRFLGYNLSHRVAPLCLY